MPRLSEVAAHIASATVVRDADFASLGLLTRVRQGQLVFLAEAQWVARLASSPAIAAVITKPEFAPTVPASMGLILTDDPRSTFYDIHEHLLRATAFYGHSIVTTIASSARVHPRAFVAERDVVIGARVVVEPHATILGGVVLRDDSVVRAGSVLGAEGFQVLASPGRPPRRIPHGGHVEVGLRAEVRAGCTVDRSLFGGATVIADDCTLDHLVYIAHDVSIGARSRVGAGAVVNGSTTIGEEAWIGPNASVAGGLVVGARARVTMGSVVTRDVPDDGHVTGNFALEHERFLNWLRSVR